MAELRWYEAYPPRDLELSQVTALLRVLGGRPLQGKRLVQPMVVFELWISTTGVRWLVGIEQPVASTLAGQFVAQLPALVLRPVTTPSRPALVTALELQPSNMNHPLRVDTASGVSAALFQLQKDVRRGEYVVVQWVVGPSHTYARQPVPDSLLALLGFVKPREPDAGERQGWKQKLNEAFLLGVRGRIGAGAADPKRGSVLIGQAKAALSLANASRTQLQTTRQSSLVATQLLRVMGKRRSWSGMLNAAELAALLGWPLSGADGVYTVTFAPPPPSLTDVKALRARSERVLGVSQHPATSGAQVRLPWSSYAAHLHLLGPSGVGKSTLLANWAIQEAEAKRSTLVIEPKGDLVTDVLARLPEHRHQDVVVIDPGADGPVVGINPLHGPRADAERRADSLLHLFRELFGTAIGPRSADVLLHSLIAICRLDDGSLPDVPAFLTNDGFRRHVLAKTRDPLTLAPWAAWFDQLSESERTQVVAPVLNKLRAVISRPSVRRSLGQPTPRFQLDELFDTPKIVLVNLNAGVISTETANLVGAVLLSQLWEAIQRQTARPMSRRREVAVIIDEWQQFTAGLDFADVLARARGARVSFTVAHQHLTQLSLELRAAVLANARSRAVMRPAEGDGAALARVLGDPVTPTDLEQLPAFHAACRMLVDGAPSGAFEVATPPLADAVNDPDTLRRISAERYGVAPGELDRAVLERWQGGSAMPVDASIGLRRRSS
ncbi:type IV secretory system conjugative DNA transfer family protein [Amycolatopsis azurea]|uniref:type IV secretory system conjugative DNA transfer family protein n=1 Tax=Amycolatopsis azurea TaxID=36819 RepID=UPI00382A4AA7